MNNSINHQEWKQLVSQYIDDELSSEEKDTLLNHLVDCPACQKYLKELQSLSLKVKSLNNQSLSSDLEQRLNNINSRTERSPMNKPSITQFLKTAVPVVVIAFLVTFTVQVYVKHGLQGRLRAAADDIGDQYSSGNTNVYRPVDQLALTRPSDKKSDYTHDETRSRVRDAAIYMKSQTAELGKSSQYEAYYSATNYPLASKVAEKNALQSVATGSLASANSLSASKTKGDNKITWKDTASTPQPYIQIYTGGQMDGNRQNTGRVDNAVRFESRTGQILSDANGMEFDRALQNRPYSAPQYPYAPIQLQESNTEQYDLINENDFADVSENPLSTFSIDVDTASYSNVRRMLTSNQLPPRDAVRIEEMINYFKYNYPQPSWNQPFSITMEQGVCPWNQGHQIVLVGLQGKELTAQQTPLSNLVFLIDVSGSMNDAKKLPLLKESLKMMVAQLRPEERVSLVVYAGNAGLVLDSTPAYNKGMIMAAIDNLQAGGSTAGGQGIQLAYDVARKNFINNGNNRVILATDGDFNVGVSSDSELVQIIEEKRKTGIFLTVLGFGTGNLQDGKMEKLADKGNGNYFYIDSIDEGKKVLVDELGSTMIAIAKDVKIQIEFNPKAVKSYRLIGYENRKLAKEDFNDDTKDAGELGAGHTVTALYEIVPAGSWEVTSGKVDPLKYQKKNEKTNYASNTEMMTVKLRYKEPKSETSQLITKVLKTPARTFGQVWFGASDNLQFASAVAECGMLLRNSQYTANSSYQSVVQRAQNSAYNDPSGHKSEFISLVQKASSLDNRQRPNVPVYQPQYPVYQQYDQQGGYQQK